MLSLHVSNLRSSRPSSFICLSTLPLDSVVVSSHCKTFHFTFISAIVLLVLSFKFHSATILLPFHLALIYIATFFLFIITLVPHILSVILLFLLSFHFLSHFSPSIHVPAVQTTVVLAGVVAVWMKVTANV